jgi:hypothetical protein
MNVDQRRVTRITPSGWRTPSSPSAANAARIVTWRRAPETQAMATAMSLLQPRSNARPIYRKRSANSGSVSHLRNVSIGRTSQRKREGAHLFSIFCSFSFSLSYGERRKSTRPCISITFTALSVSRVRRPLPMAKERPVALRSQRQIVRASRL